MVCFFVVFFIVYGLCDQYIFTGEWSDQTNCTSEPDEIRRSLASNGVCQQIHSDSGTTSMRWNLTGSGEVFYQYFSDDKCTDRQSDSYLHLGKCSDGYMKAYVGSMEDPPQELFNNQLYGSIVGFHDEKCEVIISNSNLEYQFRTLDGKCRKTLGRGSKAEIEGDVLVRKTYWDVVYPCGMLRYTEKFNIDGKCDYHGGIHEGKYYYKVEFINRK